MRNDILGLRTTIYKVNDLQKATEWYTKTFRVKPYFKEPFYVGFNIGGYELGLLPEETDSNSTEKTSNVMSYWGVDEVEKEYQWFLDSGATEHEKPTNVGGDLVVCAVKDPWSNVIGLIYNPYFKLP